MLLLSLVSLTAIAGTASPSSGAAQQGSANNVYNEDKTSIVVTAKNPQFTIRLRI